MAQLKYDQVQANLPDITSAFQLAINNNLATGKAFSDLGETLNKMYTEYKNNQFLRDLTAARDPNNVQSINEFMARAVNDPKYTGMSSETRQNIINNLGTMYDQLDKENLNLAQRYADATNKAVREAAANGDIDGLIAANTASMGLTNPDGSQVRQDALLTGDVNTLRKADSDLATEAARRGLLGAQAREANARARQSEWSQQSDNIAYMVANTVNALKDENGNLPTGSVRAALQDVQDKLGSAIPADAMYKGLSWVKTADGRTAADVGAYDSGYDRVSRGESAGLDPLVTGSYRVTNTGGRSFSASGSPEFVSQQLEQARSSSSSTTPRTQNGTTANGGQGRASSSSGSVSSPIAQSMTNQSNVEVESEQGTEPSQVQKQATQASIENDIAALTQAAQQAAVSKPENRTTNNTVNTVNNALSSVGSISGSPSIMNTTPIAANNLSINTPEPENRTTSVQTQTPAQSNDYWANYERALNNVYNPYASRVNANSNNTSANTPVNNALAAAQTNTTAANSSEFTNSPMERQTRQLQADVDTLASNLGIQNLSQVDQLDNDTLARNTDINYLGNVIRNGREVLDSTKAGLSQAIVGNQSAIDGYALYKLADGSASNEEIAQLASSVGLTNNKGEPITPEDIGSLRNAPSNQILNNFIKSMGTTGIDSDEAADNTLVNSRAWGRALEDAAKWSRQFDGKPYSGLIGAMIAMSGFTTLDPQYIPSGWDEMDYSSDTANKNGQALKEAYVPGSPIYNQLVLPARSLEKNFGDASSAEYSNLVNTRANLTNVLARIQNSGGYDNASFNDQKALEQLVRNYNTQLRRIYKNLNNR